MSNPFGGFNQRPADDQPASTPTPAKPRVEGAAKQPSQPRSYAKTNDHLPPSTRPDLVIPSAGLIARSLDAEMRLDEQKRRATVAAALNLTETDDVRHHARQLNDAVKGGEITADEA